jgi:thiol-disulfide isomerase/thioredoxin
MQIRILTPAKKLLVQVLLSRTAAIFATIALAAGIIWLTSDVQASTADAPHAASAQGTKTVDAVDFPKKGTGVHPDAGDWFNTDSPISLADLKGRIVLLDFWTLCCINCIHTLPDLAKLEARYPGVLVVIGVHSPKFDNEKKSASVSKAVLRYDIKHPVFNDADRKLWKTYGVDWWPTLVVIDPDGKFREGGFASGEGRVEEVERYIQSLIKEYGNKLKKDPITFRLSKEKAHALSFPGKILADAASKRLFIADSTNNRVVITDLSGKKIAIAGNGKEGLKDGKFSEAEFSDPQGMCLDGELLYVADRKNHAIRELNLKDQTVKIVAGNGDKQRPLPPRAPGTTWGPRKLPMSSPWDLLLYNKRIYIAAAGQHQIWYLDRSADKMGVYAGTGEENLRDAPHARANFAQPSGLATDGKKLYVADAETSTIRAVPIGGAAGEVTTIVGSTIRDKALMTFGDVNGVGTNVRLQHALGVAHDAGKLYVADTYNSKIKVIDPLKRTCDLFVGGRDEFQEPGGLSIIAGKIYVADTNNHRIQVVDIRSRSVSTLELQGVEPLQREAVSGTP